MTPRTKKLILTLAMLAWLFLYACLVMGVAVRVLPGAPWYVSLLFYALAGTLWTLPIGFSFRWVYREPRR